MTNCFYALAALSTIFTLLSYCLTTPPVVLALPISAVFTFFYVFSFICLKKTNSWQSYSIFKKMTEYAPFVYFAVFVLRRAGENESPFALDLIAAILWVAITALSIVMLIFLSEKRLAKSFPEIKRPEKEKKAIFRHILEWIDALVQAACLVLLINLFLFQLYAIPSESMVPEFMIGDRVIVVKTPSGPRFPLSKVSVPRMRSYKRGDIVTFSNPHYSDGKDAEVRSFISQLVYMITFTAVNINRDEFGNIKADPLVKRIAGVPGEKLMLVDGVLYSRREGETDFTPVAEDETWAAWNLNSLPISQKNLVRAFPLSDETYNLILSIESLRANLNVEEAAESANLIAAEFRRLKAEMSSSDGEASLEEIVPRSKLEITDLFMSNEEITRSLLEASGGSAWFSEFMTAWTRDIERDNLFDRRSANLNILLKLTFGRLVLRNAELILGDTGALGFRADPQRMSLLADADTYIFYMTTHDQRNFGEFPPSEDEYIPENCFFMVGDNRFNSLDMRHSYSMRLAPIDSGDSYSILYRSNLDPQYVPAEKILGGVIFRFWPPSRIGVPN